MDKQEREIIFDRKAEAVRPKVHPEKPSATSESSQKPRKQRSDKKENIKVKLLDDDRKYLKRQAADRRISVTAVCNEIIKISLIQDMKPVPFPYTCKGKFVNVWLEQKYFEQIQDLSVEWDVSKREVIYRFLKHHIPGNLIIHDHRGGVVE